MSKRRHEISSSESDGESNVCRTTFNTGSFYKRKDSNPITCNDHIDSITKLHSGNKIDIQLGSDDSDIHTSGSEYTPDSKVCDFDTPVPKKNLKRIKTKTKSKLFSCYKTGASNFTNNDANVICSQTGGPSHINTGDADIISSQVESSIVTPTVNVGTSGLL